MLLNAVPQPDVRFHLLSSFLKDSLFTFANTLALSVLSVTAAVFTARALGPHGKGQYAIAILIPMLAVTFGRMGLGHAANFFASKKLKEGLISNTIILSIGLGLLTTVIAFPTAILLKNFFFRDIDCDLIILSCLAIPLNMVFNHTTGLLQALYSIDIRNRIALIQALSNVGLLFLFVAEMEMGVRGTIVSLMLSFTIAIAVAWKFLFRELVIQNFYPDLKLMRTLLQFGLKSHIGNMLKDLSYRGDILILSCFLPASSVGFYITAVNLAEIVCKVPDAIGLVLLPKVAKMNKNEVLSVIPALSRSILIVVSFLSATVLVFNEEIIIMIFGYEFLPSASALKILLLGIVALSIWKILANTMIGLGHPVVYSLTTGVALIVMVTLDLTFIPIFGLFGAALASTVSYLSATVLIMFFFARTFEIKVFELLIPLWSDLSLYKYLFKSLITNTRGTHSNSR